MVRRKESFLFRPLVLRGLLVFSLLGLLGCVGVPTPDVAPTATASSTATETLAPTNTATLWPGPGQTVTLTELPASTVTATATRKARIPIRNVLIEGSSTVGNINTDVLGGKELNCDVIPPYCLTARGVGGLRASQVRDMVQKTVDLDSYQALVLYDPQNNMTFDHRTGAETYAQHRLTIDWVNSYHPDLLVVSGTALDTTMEDEKRRVQTERDNYNDLLVGGNGLGEIVFDPRSVLRRNGQPDQDCFTNGDQLHVNVVCERRILGELKKTLDWWQNSGLTLPVKQNLPLAP